MLESLPDQIDALSSRAHGRLTLRRVLLVEGTPVFVGFGENVDDRTSPLADVAALSRSFESVTREQIVALAHDATADQREQSARMRELTQRALATFLHRYAADAADLATVPRDAGQRDAMIRFFRMRGALRDVRDALTRRPATVAAAVDALLAECGA